MATDPKQNLKELFEKFLFHSPPPVLLTCSLWLTKPALQTPRILCFHSHNLDVFLCDLSVGEIRRKCSKKMYALDSHDFLLRHECMEI